MKVLKSTRSVLVAALGVSLACTLPTMVMAKVKGKVCSNCHTMHSSQQSTGLAPSSWSLADPPRGALLANTCYGCHTGNGTVRLSADVSAPQVILTSANTAQGDGILPGGFFTTAAGYEPTQHTITDLGAVADLAAPPGWDDASSPRTGLITWTDSTLVCAGTNGCHGDYNQGDQGAAISGIHHRATAIGYRGLYGIKGVESTAYLAARNGYSALLHPRDGSNPGITISALCAQCHSKFHDMSGSSDVLSSGAWIRHPADFALKSGNQLNDDYDGYGFTGNLYNEQVPVGYSGNNTNVSTYSGTTDFDKWGANTGVSVSSVICLSCHRAHGSTFNDLLRWSYSGMIAGSPTSTGAGTGCFRCHTTKDDA